jgi:hypothetical protein
MIKALMTPKTASRTMASPEMRVKIHMTYSKLHPGCTVRALILHLLAACQPVLDQDEDH